MTTTRVRLTAENSGGGRWHVWLEGDPTLAGLHGVAVVPRSIANGQFDVTGVATVDLDPTAELVPLGTVYRCDFRKVGAGVNERLYFTVPVVPVTSPVTVVDATNFISSLPSALPTPALGVETAARIAADALLIPLTQKGAANGVATLGADSKIPGSQLPALAIGETFTVASQAAMLALTAERGDMALRTDLTPVGFFVLTADAPSVLANWVQITAPGAVTSVNTRAGAVTGLAEQTALDAETIARAAADKILPSTQVTADYTPALADAGKSVQVNAAGAVTVTIPASATVAYPVDTILWVSRVGAGTVTVVGAAGVTLVTGGPISVQGAAFRLHYRGADTWSCRELVPAGTLSPAYVAKAGDTSAGEQAAPSFKASGKTGATATPVTLAGGTAAGAPTTGTHNKGEVVYDDTGAAWYCTVAGTPGTWVRVGPDESNLVHKTGAETLAGIKTFTNGFTVSSGAVANFLSGAALYTDVVQSATTGYINMVGSLRGNASGPCVVANGVAGTVDLIVKAAASQSANRQEWQSSTGTVDSRIDKAGRRVTLVATPPVLADLANGEMAISTDASGNLVITSRVAGVLKTATVAVA